MYDKGRLYVFVLQDTETKAIRAVCDDFDSVQKSIEANTNWGFPDVTVEAYRVKSITDYNFQRMAQ